MTDLGRWVEVTVTPMASTMPGRWWGSTTAAGAQHAFITGPNGVGMTDLGTLGGSSSYAHGINDAGQVVGGPYTAAGARPCFYHRPQWRGHDRSRDAGWRLQLRLWHQRRRAGGGGSDTAAGAQHAFITGPNGVGMTDLNSLVSLPGGVFLTEATGINNHGQVAAIGIHPRTRNLCHAVGRSGSAGLYRAPPQDCLSSV